MYVTKCKLPFLPLSPSASHKKRPHFRAALENTLISLIFSPPRGDPAKRERGYSFLIAVIPGSFFPSMYSSMAPPPVDT